MYKIQTLNPISPIGLEQFSHEHYEVGADIQSPDAIIVRSHNMHTMEVPHSVKVIGRAGAGINNIPVEAMTKRGIPVMNTPGANANAVREIVIAGMLLASRNLCQAWDYVRRLQGSPEEIEQQVEKNKKQFAGTELLGKTLGIVGLGNVGVKVANAAVHLGMKVIGFDPTITVNRAWELSSSVSQAHNIEDLLMRADFVSFHVPLTPETKNMINVARISLMKKGVILLNFAREGVLDNNALLDALKEKKVRAYVSDFPNVALALQPNVISLPHLGASTCEAEENCASVIVRQVKEFLQNGTINYSVNFPAIEMLRNQGAVRLAVANINVPNMVAQISSRLAHAKLNIISLLNKSRNEIAYTLIDVDEKISNELLKDIGNIEGVVQVRQL